MVKVLRSWEWTVPASHPGQTWASWMVEQTAIMLLLGVGIKAHRRGDQATADRIITISQAGKHCENWAS